MALHRLGQADAEWLLESFNRHMRDERLNETHLAHRFVRERDTTRPGRMRMMTECEELIELFQGIDHEVEGIVAPQRRGSGSSRSGSKSTSH